MDKEVINKLSNEQKVSFLRGVGSWNTYSVDELNIPSLTMSDGPIGIRKEIKDGIFADSLPSVCYPSGALLACSFDPEVFSMLSKNLAWDAKAYGIQVVLGPAMNIKRSPLGGRGFEYLSEDPFLTYKLSASYVRGMQEEHVGACVKHYAVNSSESNRFVINEIVDERTLREIYLYAFEKTIEETAPSMVMASYNKVNGIHATENSYLLQDLLRNEFSFDGVVVSDWTAVNDPVLSVMNGLTLEMPESSRINEPIQLNEIGKNPEFNAKVEKHILDLLNLVERYPIQENGQPDFEKDHELSRKLAEESIVLLKNDHILPLKKEEKIAVIGNFATQPRYQGGGSSHIHSYRETSFIDCLKDVSFSYVEGYHLKRQRKLIDLNNVKNVVSSVDKVLLFLGIDEQYESEGMDRFSLQLPYNQLRLVKEIQRINPNIVVILSSGGPLELPFESKVKGIVETYLGGEAIGEALYRILYGEVNPSGHLAETFPLKLEDNPSYPYFPGDRYNCLYKEGIYVGYRYYETFNVPVLYPFGYGLSYSSFEYSDFHYDSLTKKVSFAIKNTSKVKGKAVPQIYISKPNDLIFNSRVELSAFTKVELEPGESKQMELSLNEDSFSYFNVQKHQFVSLYGDYKVSLRSDASTIIFEIPFTLEGENTDIPYHKDQLPSYYEEGIQAVSDEEYSKLYQHRIPIIKQGKDFGMDNSLIQAKEAGSRGAKLFIFLLSTQKRFRKDLAIYKSIIECPMRALIYFAPVLNEVKSSLLDLINDRHIIKSLYRILKVFVKIK